MDLFGLIRFGYVLVVGTLMLMVWVSLARTREVDEVRYPPCYFNPLCSCSKAVPDLGIVRCKDIHLPSIPETINTSKAFMLHLENNGLRNFEPFFLQRLYKLTIKHNPLTHLPDEAFLGLERSLWELDLSYNELMKVPNRALRYLQKLRVLDLTGNDITEIMPENWRGLENSLETLILSENSINNLPTDAFTGLPLLDTIDLRGNNLRSIDPSVFRDGMGKLAHLLMSDNQLSAIPYQALQPLKQLKELDLSHNEINKMQPEVSTENPSQQFNFMMSLDTLRLDYNLITVLNPGAFQYFDNLNRTYLNGNHLYEVEENAFRQAKIRELYMKGCGLTEISPLAFGGLENYLQVLDMSGNNLTMLPQDIFHRFNVLRTLSLNENLIAGLNPQETFNGFQYTLYKLDLTGSHNEPVSIQDLRRLRNLRFLSLSRLPKQTLQADDFLEFGVDLEELKIVSAGLTGIKNNAFQYVHGLKRLDFSDNNIGSIENEAFTDIGHSLISLQMSHALSSSMGNVPHDSFKPLFNLEELDLSNNKIKSMPDTSFHFLKKLRRLEMQDNNIDQVHKGTFQGDIHSSLESIYLSFNFIKNIQQHTFVDLTSLEQLHLDDNMIQTIERRSFMNLENLKRLNLKGNKITSIGYESFQNVPELEDLDISYNLLPTFEFSMFDQVGTLAMFCVNVSHNKISDLVLNMGTQFEQNVGIGGLHSNIKILDMSHNNITVIAKNYFKPTMLSLTHLYLSYNTLFNATKDVFGNMPHLQHLDISHNRLFEMDFDTFRNTRKLQVLHISHNFIPEIPNDLFKSLSNLRVVDLSHNRFRFLPDNLFREEGLERLDLSHNQINRLPLNSMVPAAAETLAELDLSWNSISSVAHGGMFGRFKSLSWLDLSYNRLVQIDVGVFAALPRLSSLDMSHNAQLVLEKNGRSFQGVEDSLLHLGLDNVSLTYVPELPLPNLLSLSLAYNSLPTVPPEMAANISSLRRLNLDYNDLTAIPIVTHSLTNLRELSLAANPITTLSNTSLLGVADRLEVLDISDFDLNTLENGVFCKMYALHSLKLSVYENVRNFNVPRILEKNKGLRNLEINVDKKETNLKKEMDGTFPLKLDNITLTGLKLKSLDSEIFEGVRSRDFHFILRNTSVEKVPADLFENMMWVRNVSVELDDNRQLQNFGNPSTGGRPNLPKRTFLTELWMRENRWSCDCQLGWIEVWQRKRRQYLCGESPIRPQSYKSYDYICRHVNDDLRNSRCSNKNNQSLVEVLKTDIECGWSGAATLKTPVTLAIITLIAFLLI